MGATFHRHNVESFLTANLCVEDENTTAGLAFGLI